jgi:hypothetical protein
LGWSPSLAKPTGQEYVFSSDVIFDFSASATAQSAFTGTKGVVLDTGLWEVEFEGVVGQSHLTSTTVTGSLGMSYATVSGSPTIGLRTEAIYYAGASINSFGSPTFGGSASSFSINGLITAPTASTSRYTRVWYKARLRVNGSGASIRFYPTLFPSAITDNPFFITANSKFRVVKVDDTSTANGNMTVVS